MRQLTDEIAWRQESIHMFGRLVKLPRLTAWYGDKGTTYTYSGITSVPHPWTESLKDLKARVERACAASFNSVLLNLYRDEKDSVSWHSDDEPELGASPTIASVSLGETRRFELKHKQNSVDRVKLNLTNGSLLTMRGTTQSEWLHQVPKEKFACKPRINLTFRQIQKN